MQSSTLKKTALNETCRKYGGKMVDFHGWELPIQFEGITKEHNTVRNGAGIFDVSHMGQIFVTGKDAAAFLDYVNANDVKKLQNNQGCYSHLPNGRKGIVDDVINFCLNKEEGRYLVIVNATTSTKDYEWFLKNSKGFQVKIENKSDDYSMVALQGPKTISIMKKFEPAILKFGRFSVVESSFMGEKIFVSRTGYTGEDGFEVAAPHKVINQIWDKFFELGKSEELIPCGLGSRDTLRLESGYLLYGNDIDDEHTSYEANYGWVVKLKKEKFIGKDIYEKQKAEGVKIRLTGLTTQTGIPREGCKVFKDGRQIGTLQSATFSPTLKKGIGVGYFDIPDLKPGDSLEVEIRDKKVPSFVHEVPFYKGGAFGKVYIES
ncbi:MAG: glycine cleavage system aminomethyltransferase GcvT [Elusimicrobia bacterium]|nr:glycine cleavage system aminomethyltransferase GcvT [Elusimicrobiota bacterium]